MGCIGIHYSGKTNTTLIKNSSLECHWRVKMKAFNPFFFFFFVEKRHLSQLTIKNHMVNMMGTFSKIPSLFNSQK